MGYFKFTTIKTIANNARRMGATGLFVVKNDYLGVMPDFDPNTVHWFQNRSGRACRSLCCSSLLLVRQPFDKLRANGLERTVWGRELRFIVGKSALLAKRSTRASKAVWIAGQARK